MKFKFGILLCIVLNISAVVYSHPTGNMITVGEHVLWSYINPINDPEHHACIMIWHNNSEPKVFLQSEHAASDYMLYNDQEDIYIIERRLIEKTQNFQIRVLKTRIDTTPNVIWDWFEDKWRIGEGGFFMLSENEIVFGRYPEVYRMEKGKSPTRYFQFNEPVKRIRAVENNKILLLGDYGCYLTDQNGRILKH